VHTGSVATGVVQAEPPQSLRQHFRTVPSQLLSAVQAKSQAPTSGAVISGIGQYPGLLVSTGGVVSSSLQVTPQGSSQHFSLSAQTQSFSQYLF
jgi:hypothetical protein